MTFLNLKLFSSAHLVHLVKISVCGFLTVGFGLWVAAEIAAGSVRASRSVRKSLLFSGREIAAGNPKCPGESEREGNEDKHWHWINHSSLLQLNKVGNWERCLSLRNRHGARCEIPPAVLGILLKKVPPGNHVKLFRVLLMGVTLLLCTRVCTG
jgi:hypothetical protein